MVDLCIVLALYVYINYLLVVECPEHWQWDVQNKYAKNLFDIVDGTLFITICSEVEPVIMFLSLALNFTNNGVL